MSESADAVVKPKRFERRFANAARIIRDRYVALGEWYRKLGWKTKTAINVGLIIIATVGGLGGAVGLGMAGQAIATGAVIGRAAVGIAAGSAAYISISSELKRTKRFSGPITRRAIAGSVALVVSFGVGRNVFGVMDAVDAELSPPTPHMGLINTFDEWSTAQSTAYAPKVFEGISLSLELSGNPCALDEIAAFNSVLSEYEAHMAETRKYLDAMKYVDPDSPDGRAVAEELNRRLIKANELMSKLDQSVSDLRKFKPQVSGTVAICT